MAYWIHENGETIGPLRAVEVLDRARVSTLVSCDQQWLRLDQHPDFAALVSLQSQPRSLIDDRSDVVFQLEEPASGHGPTSRNEATDAGMTKTDPLGNSESASRTWTQRDDDHENHLAEPALPTLPPDLTRAARLARGYAVTLCCLLGLCVCGMQWMLVNVVVLFFTAYNITPKRVWPLWLASVHGLLMLLWLPAFAGFNNVLGIAGLLGYVVVSANALLAEAEPGQTNFRALAIRLTCELSHPGGLVSGSKVASLIRNCLGSLSVPMSNDDMLLPNEDPGVGILRGFAPTLKLFVFRPLSAFERIRRSESVLPPVFYSLAIVALILGAFWLNMTILWSSLNSALMHEITGGDPFAQMLAQGLIESAANDPNYGEVVDAYRKIPVLLTAAAVVFAAGYILLNLLRSMLTHFFLARFDARDPNVPSTLRVSLYSSTPNILLLLFLLVVMLELFSGSMTRAGEATVLRPSIVILLILAWFGWTFLLETVGFSRIYSVKFSKVAVAVGIPHFAMVAAVGSLGVSFLLLGDVLGSESTFASKPPSNLSVPHDRYRAEAQLIVRLHPDLEQLAVDDAAGTMKIRNTNTGQILRVSFQDIVNGELVFTNDNEPLETLNEQPVNSRPHVGFTGTTQKTNTQLRPPSEGISCEWVDEMVPADVDALFECGLRAEANGELDLATQRFRRVLELRPAHSMASQKLMQLNRGTGTQVQVLDSPRSVPPDPSPPITWNPNDPFSEAEYLLQSLQNYDISTVDREAASSRLEELKLLWGNQSRRACVKFDQARIDRAQWVAMNQVTHRDVVAAHIEQCDLQQREAQDELRGLNRRLLEIGLNLEQVMMDSSGDTTYWHARRKQATSLRSQIEQTEIMIRQAHEEPQRTAQQDRRGQYLQILAELEDEARRVGVGI